MGISAPRTYIRCDEELAEHWPNGSKVAASEDENGNGGEECGRCGLVIATREESVLPEAALLRALRIALDTLSRPAYANDVYTIEVVKKALAEHR